MRSPSLLALALFSVSAGSRAQATREERAPATVPTVLEGVVLTPEGRPARGAVVVTSAGGETVSGEDGSFRLEVELPLDAFQVQATAVQSAGTETIAGSARIDVTAGGSCWGGVLRLGSSACQPQWVPTFGGVNSLEGMVLAITVFDDGSGAGPAIIAGGNLGRAGAFPASNLAKWDGTRWSPLGSLDDNVLALAVFDDGGGPALYVAGLFTSASGVAANRIVKWDGTSWSALGAGLNSSVQELLVFDDGSGPALYAGGGFTTAGGVSAKRIARWDGTSWSALGAGLNLPVRALAAFDDGSGPALYVGGTFTKAGGAPAEFVAKWDGASWSPLGSGASNPVLALARCDVGSGPALYSAGEGGQVGRWDGASWSFLTPISNSVYVSTLTSFDDGSGAALYAGGRINPIERNRIVKWDGTSWSVPGGVWEWHGSGEAMMVYDDGTGNGPELYTEFSVSDGTTWRELAEYPPILDAVAHAPEVHALAVFDDASAGGPALYAGGSFVSAGETLLNRVARWDGASWSPLGAGLGQNHVYALATFDDGLGGGPALYAGGDFSSFGGPSAIARWDGTSWSPLPTGLTGYASFHALATFDDGGGPALYAGGWYSGRIARWDGTNWTVVVGELTGTSPGSSPIVYSLIPFDDGTGPALYVGGQFSSANSGPAASIARWDGASWSPLGSGVTSGSAEGAVRCMEVFDDGSSSGPALFVGGTFSHAGGVLVNNAAKWDGTSWSALGTGMNAFVEDLKVFDDGNGPALYACGLFTSAGGVAARGIARWDGSSWYPVGSGLALTYGFVTARVNAMTVFDDGQSGPALIAGGQFLSAIDSGDSFIARWQGCIDTGPPVLSMPESVTAYDGLGGAPGRVVTFTVTASDFFDPAPNVVCVPPSGSFFPRGTTMVDCTATDASGNQTAGSFPVVVAPRLRQRER